MELNILIDRVQSRLGISRAVLSSTLGYKSPTSLQRIVDGKAGRKSTQRCIEQLLALGVLTEEEKLAVTQLEERQRLGSAQFEFAAGMLRFLRVDSEQTDGPNPFRRLDFELRKGCRYSVVIVNCLSDRLISHIAESLSAAQGIPIRISHYCCSDPGATGMPCLLNTVRPLLHRTNYSLSLFTAMDIKLQGIIGGDLISLTEEAPDGEKKYRLYALYDKGVRKIELSSSFCELAPPESRMYRINRADLPYVSNRYDRYLEFCSDLERGNAVYQIKPDLGIEQVHYEILAEVVRDSYGEENLQSMLPIIRARTLNLLRKKKPQYHIWRPEAMHRFIETGCLSDHVSGMRSLTCGERTRVLESILDRLDHNPYFHVYFFHDSSAWREDEVTLYMGRGLSIVKPHTEYRLNVDHNESLVQGPQEFIDAFRQFYLDHMVRTECIGREESRRVLQDMVSKCRKMG